MIAFTAKNFFGQRQWKGQLSENGAVFVAATTHDVLVATKDNVAIEVHRKVVLGKNRKATFRIRDQVLQGLISPESLAVYESWKTRETSAG